MRKIENTEKEGKQHPNMLDRNRAILLARDLLSINDWVLIAVKVSRLTGQRAIPGDASELVSITVIGPGEKVLLDMLVRPDGAVSSELLSMHGCTQAQAFNAPVFAELHKILNAGFRKTRVLAFNPTRVKDVLNELCKREKLAPLEGTFVDLQLMYTRFVGEKESDTAAGYKRQTLHPSKDSSQIHVAGLTECKYVLSLLNEMAGSSQSYDMATAFNKGWSAAFYKPKAGPAEKIKEMLGLSD